MELSVDQNFTSDHNDTESTVYQSFTSNFCSEIDKVYGNTTTGFGGGYKRCVVRSLREGSIIVIFTFYITGVNQAQVNTLDAKLNASLQINSFYLGNFIVIIGSIQIKSSTIIQALPVVSTPPQGEVTSAITSVSTEDITTSSTLVSTTKADTTTLTTTSDTTTSTTEADTITSTTALDTTTSTTEADTTSRTEADTTTPTTSPDTTTSTTEAETTTSTTAIGTTTSTTETVTTTLTTMADITTSTIVPDTTTTTAPDTPTSTKIAETTKTTTAPETTTSTTPADTTTSTTASDTTTSTTASDTTITTTEADATKLTTATDKTTSTTEAETTTSTTAIGTTTSTTETVTTTLTTMADITTSTIVPDTTTTTAPDTPTSTKIAETTKTTTAPETTTSTTPADTTTSTTASDTTTSTTASDTTITTTEADATKLTTAMDKTTSTTEVDTTTSTTVADTTKSTRIADTTTATTATDTTTITDANTITSTTTVSTTTSTTEADTTTSTTEADTTTSTTEVDTSTLTPEADKTTSKTTVGTTTSTTIVGTTTSTTEADTTTFTTMKDTTTPTTEADTFTLTTEGDTTTSTTEAATTTSTTGADTTTSTTEADTTVSTTEADTTTSTAETDTTTPTIAADTTTSTTEADTTTSTTEADTTTSTIAADTTTSTTETDTTTPTIAADTTTSTTETDTTTPTIAADTTTSMTEGDTTTSTIEAHTTTSTTEAHTTTSTSEADTTRSTTEADTTTSTAETDTTTPTIAADTTTSTTEADTTTSTTEAYTTTSTIAADTTTSTTETDTTTPTIAADTTTSTTETDTTTPTIAADTTTSMTEGDTTTSTIEADATTSTTEAATTITSTITETTGTTITTTTVQQADVNCPDALFTIGNPAVYNCTLSGTEFTEISVSNLNRTASKLASIDKNGTVTYEPPVALTVKYVPGEKIELIFVDITCSDEGLYEIIVTGEPGDTKSTGRIAVQRVPAAPTLSMHEDQVIDLQFYRLGSENKCEAEVGYPPGHLVIEVKNNNSLTYEELPPLDITYTDNTTIAGDCSNTQLLKFGMNYTSAMNNGKIRCRVGSPVTSETISTEEDLFLIPRDICACNTVSNGVTRGHPKKCDVYVECRERDYPAGVLCPSPQCRNSVSGECSSNCSVIVCNEEVPQDYCTTPPPSTTTPAPSLYISCNESIGVLIYTETVRVICVLNQTSNFQVINITKVTTTEEDLAEIAQNGNVELLTDDDNIDVTYESAVIKVTFKNVSCLDEGAYRFSVQFGEETATAQTSVSVLQKPNNPATLTLHADQIADLGFYRGDSRHSCVADIGYPAGTLNVEILNEGESEFKVLDLPAGYTVTDTKSNCMVNRKIEFGIEFTSAMNGAIIRCAVENNNFKEEFISFSQNETASLVPHDFCINNTVTPSFHQHPEDCTKYVQCAGKVTFAKSCPIDQCFGIKSVTCDYCTNVQCKLETTTEPELTTTEPTTTDKSITSQIAMNCTTNSNFVGSGPANITCSFTPSAILNGINISRSVNSSSSVLGTVNSVGTLTDQSPDGIQLKYTSTNYVVLSVEISTMSCADQGTYDFIATQQDNVTYNGQEMLIAKAKPSNPTLDLSHQTVVNKQSQAIVCKAQVGNPAGSIEVLVKQENEANFTTYKNFQTTHTSKQLECNTEVEIKISQAFTSEWNNSKIRCTVKNDETIDENEEYTSNEDTLILIPDDYCSGMGETEYKPHPRGGCSYFIRCVNGRIYSNKCQDTLCFNGNLELCDHCFNVNSATCNFT